MATQRLTTSNDERCSFDPETGALRSFIGAELVGSPEDLDAFKRNVPRVFDAASETRSFLETNKELFKLENISLEQPDVREGQAIKSVRYHQYHYGVPVYGAEIVIGLRAIDGHIISGDNKLDYSIPNELRPEEAHLSAVEAQEVVRRVLKNEVRSVEFEPYSGFFLYRQSLDRQVPPPRQIPESWKSITGLGTGIAGQLYWVRQVKVSTHGPDGNWEILVDAFTGNIIAVFDRRSYAPPNAFVFMPDPITSSTNSQLCWNTDVSTLDGERVQVTLNELDAPDANGNFNLRGTWVTCADREKATFPSPQSKGDFMYGSKDPEFLFTMAYYWSNELVKYLRSVNIPELNQKMIAPLDLDPMGLQEDSSGAMVELDNSHFVVDKGKPYIAFGMAGVPDASDAHVIVHEYGHAVHYFLDSRQSCYEEGFCDFLAGIWLDRFNTKSFNRMEVFPWDNCECIRWNDKRRLDLMERFSDTDFLSYGTYLRGNIFATALWDLFMNIGGNDANPATREAAADVVVRLYLQGLLSVSSYAYPDVLAKNILAVDQAIYGLSGKYRQQIWDAFRRRGLWDGNPPLAAPPPNP